MNFVQLIMPKYNFLRISINIVFYEKTQISNHYNQRKKLHKMNKLNTHKNNFHSIFVNETVSTHLVIFKTNIFLLESIIINYQNRTNLRLKQGVS